MNSGFNIVWSFRRFSRMKEVIITKDSVESNKIAAQKFVSIARKALENKNKFAVALAGGSTPKSLYNLLTTDEFRWQIDWRKVFFFFGDERNVLPDSDESNFRMANENLLKPLEIGAGNIFRWQTEIADAEKVAENYEQTIAAFFNLTKNEFPRFDLILLGMGDDGHTASLFPFSKALHETKRIAVANFVEKFNTNRLTLTFPAINNASNVIFLVGDADKATALKEILKGASQPEKFPAQNVNPENGDLFWLINQPAARFLT